MKCRYWDLDYDYDMITSWLKEYEYNSLPPKNILSNYGVIIEDDEAICAAALYIDTGEKKSGFAYMYGIFANPIISKIKLYKAMIMCLDEIKALAKQNGIELIYTTTGEDALCKLYERKDMTLVENNLSAYVMEIDSTPKDLRWLMNDEIENLMEQK